MQWREQRKNVELNKLKKIKKKRESSVVCGYIDFLEQDAVRTDVLVSSVWGYDLQLNFLAFQLLYEVTTDSIKPNLDPSYWCRPVFPDDQTAVLGNNVGMMGVSKKELGVIKSLGFLGTLKTHLGTRNLNR